MAVRCDRSREEFSRQIGVHRNTLAKWEEDKTQPPLATLEQIATRNDVPLAWLLHGFQRPAIDRTAPEHAENVQKAQVGQEPFPGLAQGADASNPFAGWGAEKNDLDGAQRIAAMEDEVASLKQALDERREAQPALDAAPGLSIIEEMKAVEAKLLSYEAPQHIIREALVAVLEARSGRHIGAPNGAANYKDVVDKRGLDQQRVAEDTPPFGKDPKG